MEQIFLTLSKNLAKNSCKHLKTLCTIPKNLECYLDGLDISNSEVKYDKGGNTYLNLNYYVYAVTLKELTINSSGISLV